MAQSSDQSGIWLSNVAGSPYGKARTPGEKIRILVVDDHAGYRQGLLAMIELEDGMEAVGEASDGREALEQVSLLKPDVVLMDVNMPGMDGMEATRKLADAYPGILVIMLTMFKGEEHLREARRAGASAYVVKDADSEVLLGTIRDVMSGDVPLLYSNPQADAPPKRLAESRPRPSTGTDLLITANERVILKHLASGLSNSQIAHRTGLTQDMVRTYIAEICSKLGLKGRDAAIEYARTRGFGEG
jgi:DNA-binding NarL/FixJ family response regulator